MATTREILKPRWDNDSKTAVTATFRYTDDDGSIRDAKATITNAGGNNPDWAEVMDTFSTEDLDANTAERVAHITSVNTERDERHQGEKERQLQEHIFDNKLTLFENDHVSNSEDVDRKREIRKSQNDIDLHIATVDLMIADAFKRAGIELPAANTTWTSSE